MTVDSNSLEFILLHTSYLSDPTRLTCVESNFLCKAFTKILMEMTPEAAAMVVFTYVLQPDRMTRWIRCRGRFGPGCDPCRPHAACSMQHAEHLLCEMLGAIGLPGRALLLLTNTGQDAQSTSISFASTKRDTLMFCQRSPVDKSLFRAIVSHFKPTTTLGTQERHT